VVLVNWVGKSTPLHCTSNGKVLLAYLPAAERARLLASPLSRLTGRTITDPAALERQLGRAVAEGYAFTLEELELGLNAVAAPVFDRSGECVAAVSVAGPAYRVTPQRLGELGQMARETGEAISRRLGYTGKGG
jgi:DNA-binding IclR family transcriptional regulator